MADTLTAPEFVAWPKTARLFRDMVITEKIDGTNGCIVVQEDGNVWAQSRNRLLLPPSEFHAGTDNSGFRAWVDLNASDLAEMLGVGHHYGEWWGKGIQRNYGLDEKRFSLFNTHKWDYDVRAIPGLDVVPVISSYTFDTNEITDCLDQLRDGGSFAAPGFMNPEGVCIYHTASNQVFKATLEKDEQPKGFNG